MIIHTTIDSPVGPLLLAADDEGQLPHRLQELESFRPRATIGGAASADLLERLRAFIFDEQPQG